MDIEHFQIIVNAMLSWQNESHAPSRAPIRPAAVPKAPGDELDDDDEYLDDEAFEPEESLNIEPEAVDADVADADLLDSEQLD